MNITILIPARSGSKRVPGKNKKILGGKPLISYSIEHAIKICDASCIYITTDDNDIKDIVRGYGCKIIDRPDVLATDSAKSIDVITHAILYLKSSDVLVDNVMLLQPTVPIRDIENSKLAIKKLIDESYDSVISYIPLDFYHPKNFITINNDLIVEFSNLSIGGGDFYCRDGSLYLFKSNVPFDFGNLYGINRGYVLTNPEKFVNIDTERDWLLAESLISKF